MRILAGACFLIVLGLTIAACGPSQPSPTAKAATVQRLSPTLAQPSRTPSPQATSPPPTTRPSPTPTASPTSMPSPATITHTVKSGDTLSAIASQYGTTVEAIAEANKLADPNWLTIGQKLVIPIGKKPPTSPTPTPPGTVRPTPLGTGTPGTPKPAPSGRFGAIVFSASPQYPTSEARTEFPSNISRIHAHWTYKGMSNGTPWNYVWLREGQEIAKAEGRWQWGEEGGTHLYLGPQPWSPGNYEIRLYIEGSLERSATFTIR